jgi:hypothetical protein
MNGRALAREHLAGAAVAEGAALIRRVAAAAAVEQQALPW